jgi:site-specific DNA recombinase
MGMKERVKSGLWMGGGRIPFGYDYDKTKGILVPNKDADKVRKIYDMYINGMAAQEIANILDLKYERLVTQILKRKSNYGIIEYNGEEYQGQHEPIINKEIYDKAMHCMIERSSTRTSTTEHLLTGLVYCGKCGAKMRYQKWGTKGCKLVCYSRQKSKPYLVKDPNCDQEYLWADEIEEEILKYLFSLKEKEREEKKESYVVETNLLEVLNNQYMDLQKKIKRLYNLYAEDDSDILLETINEEKRKLEDIEKKIFKETENKAIKNVRRESEDTLTNLSDMWDYMTTKEKQNALRLILNKVIITGHEINIDIKI